MDWKRVLRVVAGYAVGYGVTWLTTKLVSLGISPADAAVAASVVGALINGWAKGQRTAADAASSSVVKLSSMF